MGEDKKKDALKTEDLPRHVDKTKKKTRSAQPSLVSFLLILCSVMAGTVLYLVITHLIFPGVAILESHVATIILDSFVATAIAFFVMRKINSPMFFICPEKKLDLCSFQCLLIN